MSDIQFFDALTEYYQQEREATVSVTTKDKILAKIFWVFDTQGLSSTRLCGYWNASLAELDIYSSNLDSAL